MTSVFQIHCIAMKVEIGESRDCYFLLSLIFSLKSETQRYSVFERTQPALLNKQIQAGILLAQTGVPFDSGFNLSTIYFQILIFYSTQYHNVTTILLERYCSIKGEVRRIFFICSKFLSDLN